MTEAEAHDDDTEHTDDETCQCLSCQANRYAGVLEASWRQHLTAEMIRTFHSHILQGQMADTHEGSGENYFACAVQTAVHSVIAEMIIGMAFDNPVAAMMLLGRISERVGMLFAETMVDDDDDDDDQPVTPPSSTTLN